jgi:hypothetical protein
VNVTLHALQRYHERVKPALPYWKAKAEFEVLLEAAPRMSEVPDWHYTPEAGITYYLIADGICALVKDESVVTVIVRGSLASEVQEARRAWKRDRRRRRRFARDHRDYGPNRKRDAA